MKNVIYHIVDVASLCFWFSFALFFLARVGDAQKAQVPVNVGVVLDTNTTLGEMSMRAINMSLSEFYRTRAGLKTRLVLHIRDSKDSIVGAASAAIDLIKNKEVVAILGPGSSMQAHFLISLGNHSQIPIISFSATSPLLSDLRSPYFVRPTHDDSSQVHAISAIIEMFRWREVVPIYVDNDYGDGILPYLVDAFQEINVRIRYRSAISLFATDDQIREELYKLMTMPTRVFIVHMLPDLGSRIFSIAKEIGMMDKGYAWIVTSGMADILNLVEMTSLESMHGVLGVTTYFSKSKELIYFKTRWTKKFRAEELNNFGFWAYDAATALAMAVEEIGVRDIGFNNTSSSTNGTDFEGIGISVPGPKLLQSLSRLRFKGTAGEFRLVKGQLGQPTFRIVNIEDRTERTVGFWTPEKGLVQKLGVDGKEVNISRKSRLRPIIWPGDTTSVPKGWEIPINGKKLRIVVPKKKGFSNFVKVTRDSSTNATIVSGFCIDVFDTVMKQMPYAVPYEYIPFETPDGKSSGSYDEMVYRVFLGDYDAAVGDTTILANRSSYVDFAMPYSETGVVFVVPVTDTKEKDEWVFLKPLTWKLWLATGVAFFYIAVIVYIFEYRQIESEDMLERVFIVLYFSFSTLFFAHRKPATSICTRIIVVMWCFVVLILTQSYTATLTSMLTIQQLRPTLKNLDDLRNSGVNIGYQTGSFTFEKLRQLGFDESRLKTYGSPEEMRDLFTSKSKNGGIDAAFDEIAYVRLFMAKYCSEYQVIEPKYKADGFGFAFPMGSPLVPDISRQILNVTEGDALNEITDKWLRGQGDCPDSSPSDSPISLDFKSFRALFYIVFVVSLLLLLVLLMFRRFGPQDGEPIAGAHGGEPIAAAHGGQPIAGAQGGQPIAGAQGGEPIAAAHGGEPIAVAHGGQPIAGAQGGQPIAGAQGGEPIAAAHGGEPIAAAQGGTPIAAAQEGPPIAGAHDQHIVEVADESQSVPNDLTRSSSDRGVSIRRRLTRSATCPAPPQPGPPSPVA